MTDQDDLSDLSRAALGAAVVQMFDQSPDEAAAIQPALEKAIEELRTLATRVKSGAWIIVNTGLDAKGEVQGMVGMGGSAMSLKMLREVVGEAMQVALKQQGHCCCPTCLTRSMLHLIDGQKSLEARRDSSH